MAQPIAHGARAERTRGAILRAAEDLFAERGFDATRLEDIAEGVGIRRASIVYYFRDKREIYDAVLGEVFGALREVLTEALSTSKPVLERVEAGVSAWVEFVGHRPSVARLLLREVANSDAETRDRLRNLVAPFMALIQREFFERADYDAQPVARLNPIHLAATISGGTVFFFAALPALVADLGIDLESPERVETHKRELVRYVRRLLET